MLDDIFSAIFSIADGAGTATNTENRSIIFKILGIAVWVLLVVGIIGMFIYWFK